MNQDVGEREIKIGSEGFKCRPSFQAITEIEFLTSSSIVKVFDRFGNGEPKITDVAAIIYACHKDFNPSTSETLQSIGSKVFMAGMQSVAIPAFELIANVLAGNEQEKKKETAKPKKRASE